MQQYFFSLRQTSKKLVFPRFLPKKLDPVGQYVPALAPFNKMDISCGSGSIWQNGGTSETDR